MMKTDQIKTQWGATFRPPESLTVWEHAAKHVNLSKKISSFPGFYDPDFNPMLNGIWQRFDRKTATSSYN